MVLNGVMFKRTSATNKVLALKRRTKIIQGGTAASKTYSILAVLINKAIRTPGLEISVVAESIPHLRRGALKDFLKILKWTNRYNDEQFNKSLLTYNFKNGSVFEFFSADDSSKLRGARRDILYINECNNVTFESYNELAIRTKKEVFLDFNPANEFWVHTELKDEPDADFIILTYKDNEALDNSIVEQIEKNREKSATSSYWANWWRVYGLGEIGMLEGVIFSNWKQIDQLPSDARLVGIGLDADSSEPKSIDEIRRYGITIKGVTKGKDSINYGIDVMQQQEYLVTSNSVNLIKELRAYCWGVDKAGTRLNKPIDTNNHAIDALRYHEMETLGLKKNYGTYNLR